MAAAGCATRACALAIATAACVGLPGALVYAIVRMAAARRFGATFAFCLVLVFWVTISAAYYPRICADIIPWSALLRRLRRRRAPWPRHHPHGGGGAAAGSAVAVPLPAVAERQRGRGGGPAMLPQDPPLVPPPPVPCVVTYGTLASYGRRQRGNDGGALLPLFVARRQAGYGGMDALPREPPVARAVARVADNGGEACKRCAVCLCDVEKVETAAWLPACLHVFHRPCIDQWLHQHGHSTCPICRCHAFAVPLSPEETAAI